MSECRYRCACGHEFTTRSPAPENEPLWCPHCGIPVYRRLPRRVRVTLAGRKVEISVTPERETR